MEGEKMRPPIRVLIVEDSPVAREFLAYVLSSDPAIQVVGFARNGAEAVEVARKERPDVITMDIHMPHMDGLEATERIMAFTPTPILVVSSSVHGEGMGRALAGRQYSLIVCSFALHLVPASRLPALAYAQAMQERAGRIGFLQPDAELGSRVGDLLAQVATATTQEEKLTVYGNLLFALVQIARWLGVEAEEVHNLLDEMFL